MHSRSIRAFDMLFSLLALILALPLMLLLALLGLWDTGSPWFVQSRVGKGGRPFKLIKFRTMYLGTASVSTHEIAKSSVTPLGRFLRASKLDELPQLINVLKGDMSLVGPRPCLPTQELLIAERSRLGVFDVLPGITGLAQVNGIDMSDPTRLAKVDARMIQGFSARRYFTYLTMTALGRGLGDKVEDR